MQKICQNREVGAGYREGGDIRAGGDIPAETSEFRMELEGDRGLNSPLCVGTCGRGWG